jgi:hypothetical protein
VSNAALSWAFNAPVHGPLKAVLVALADHADEEGGNCYPSIDRLILFSGFKERAVQYALRELVALGWISAGSKIGGRSNPTRYTLHVDRLSPSEDCKPALLKEARRAPLEKGARDAGKDARGAQKSAPGAQKDAPHAPEPLLTPINPQEPPARVSASDQVDLLGEVPAPPKKEPAKLNGHAADFEKWYSVYPKKEDRGHAVAAYAKAIKAGATPTEILAGLQRNVAVLRAKDRQFIPLPATWLNGQRWTDEAPPPEKSVMNTSLGVDTSPWEPPY